MDIDNEPDNDKQLIFPANSLPETITKLLNKGSITELCEDLIILTQWKTSSGAIIEVDFITGRVDVYDNGVTITASYDIFVALRVVRQ